MAETVDLPDSGEEIPERRRRGERRRSAGRRDEDFSYASGRMPTAWAAFWAVVGGLVVLYLFLVTINAVKPDKAPAASIVVVIMAVAWLAHSWRRIWSGGFSSRGDRERRGF